jgi:hypothetical protein
MLVAAAENCQPSLGAPPGKCQHPAPPFPTERKKSFKNGSMNSVSERACVLQNLSPEYHSKGGKTMKIRIIPGSQVSARPIVALLLAVSLLAWAVPGAAGETIGVVRTAGGPATIVRGDQTLPAAPGTHLLAGDSLSTGPGGSLGVIFRDNSTLSLGPESNLVVRKFLFSPAEGRFGLLARLSRGTMAYLSGLIGKLAPESARFDTPVASIGIRGTRFVVRAGEPASR